jgi:lipoprotein-releasing system permease protein
VRYELWVGLRYLRAKRSEVFISLITVISIVGVMIGVMTLNIVLAVMTGFEEDLRDRILGFNPHIVLMSYAGTIKDPADVLTTVRDTPGVVASAPLVYGQVMVSTGQSVSGVIVRGVPTDLADAVIDLEKHIASGSLAGLGAPFEVPVEGGDGTDTVELTGILLGKELAKQLGLQVGDPVSIVSPIGSASPVGMIPKVKRFVVAGTFDSGMVDYDTTLLYMSLADAQRFFGLGDAITGVEIRVADLYGATAVARRLEQTLGPPYRARDWMEVNRNLFLAFRLEKVVYFIVLTLIVLVAAFNIVATLIMVVMEKRKDIAILKSMGATRASIARIFVLKGAIIGVVGTLLGVLGGYAGCWVLARYQFVELPKDVFYVSTVPVRIYGENFVTVALVSVVICLLATIYPARQAAGLAPVEVIRYE